VRPAVPGDVLCVDRSEVALAAAAVDGGIAVQDLQPAPASRDADAVARPWDGCEIAGEDQRVATIVPAADEGDDARLPVVAVDPLETRGVEVELVKRRRGAVERVQVADPAPEPQVQGT